MILHSDTPKPGYYLTAMVRGGPMMPVRIWYGPTPDPDFPDNEMDRSPRWNAEVAGEEIRVERVWPYCERRPIDEAEYRYRLDAAAWDRVNDPSAPAAKPYEPVDLNSARPIF